MSENTPEGDRQDPAEANRLDTQVDTSEQASPPAVEVAPAQPEVQVAQATDSQDSSES